MCRWTVSPPRPCDRTDDAARHVHEAEWQNLFERHAVVIIFISFFVRRAGFIAFHRRLPSCAGPRTPSFPPSAPPAIDSYRSAPDHQFALSPSCDWLPATLLLNRYKVPLSSVLMNHLPPALLPWSCT